MSFPVASSTWTYEVLVPNNNLENLGQELLDAHQNIRILKDNLAEAWVHIHELEDSFLIETLSFVVPLVKFLALFFVFCTDN
jgi:hypothetical protein